MLSVSIFNKEVLEIRKIKYSKQEENITVASKMNVPHSKYFGVVTSWVKYSRYFLFGMMSSILRLTTLLFEFIFDNID